VHVHARDVHAPRMGARAQVLIVEEAAEVLEAHVLACLTRSTEHLVGGLDMCV
jgi:hypothetical protein